MTQDMDAPAARAALAAPAGEPPAEVARLTALINAPELDNFLRAVHIEAVHQVERWGNARDRAKRPADWFWLVGYLGGKALHAAVSGERDKALHHCVSTAAALYNWHCAIKGVDVRMCPGRSDLAEMVDAKFPGEAAAPAGAPAPMKTWQHDETGRICLLERSPGPRWAEVPSESPASPQGEAITDDQIWSIWHTSPKGVVQFARSIEAAVRASAATPAGEPAPIDMVLHCQGEDQ